MVYREEGHCYRYVGIVANLSAYGPEKHRYAQPCIQPKSHKVFVSQDSLTVLFSMAYIMPNVSSRKLRILPISIVLLFAGPLSPRQVATQDSAEVKGDVFDRVIANQKRMEAFLDAYERIQRIEIRKTGSDANPSEIKVWRLFPGGPALHKIPLSPSGTPTSTLTYRNELEKLAKYLTWASQSGQSQRDAYAKMEHKRKERNDLLASTHEAFLFTPLGQEPRGNQILNKYSMTPNPKFHPTTRNAVVFSKVSGFVWIDEQSGELARIEGTVTEDISIAMFLAKVYKGSHFMQERYEFAPGVWLPSYEQYDFDGRKYLLSFSIHERTFYSGYKKVGPPSEAVSLVRAELDKLPAE